MTVGEWIIQARTRLNEFESAALEAHLLAAHVLGVDRTWVLVHPEHEFRDLAGEVLLLRRLSGEPLPYILGRKEFFGRDFAVGPGALIPRPETEHLVEVAFGLEGVRTVLDVGTGTGCIGITLKLERPEWEVTLVDVSADALKYAERNARDLAAEVRLHLGDFAEVLSPGYDLVVTNPPYVAVDDELGPGVREFEPATALFAEENGLAIYRRLAREVCSRFLVAEIGLGQEPVVRAIFAESGWEWMSTTEDLTGIPRVLCFAASSSELRP
jgi:release factor glutamine methyltransferase